jgi:CHAD domain-containing protein
MSFRLRLDDPPGEAVRAVAVERLTRASQRVRDDPVNAVHGARKDLKKTRAALRLVRPCLPRDVYRHENTRLRDIGRGMSGTRDADVMVATVDALAERFVGQLPKGQFTALKRRVAAQSRDEALVCGRARLANPLRGT